jgi:hypothetical protein
MNKFTIPLSLLAAATLAACGSQQVRTDDSAYYVTPVPGSSVRAGAGKVAELLDPNGPVDGISWQRMTLKMDDGSSQIIDRRGKQVAMGEHVRVRADSSLARDPYTSRATP